MQKFNVLLFLILCSWSLSAQQMVGGRITDAADGSEIIGATIVEKGTSNGTASNAQGQYSLRVSGPDAVLVVSYTGYTTLEVPIQGRPTVDITLGEAENLIDQVVVVGYGVQRKSDLTGSVGQVKADAIKQIPTGTLEQALQGKIAGVYVTPTSGEPGQGAIIRVRGTGTLNNANPIYVIDGMITYDANFLNPQDVASVEVLKDASAQAIYGSRGANGVIIITTKNGKQRQGEAVISLNAFYGQQEITRQIDMVNAAQFIELYNELEGVTPLPAPADAEGTNWQDVIFRKAPVANINLGITGGGDRFSYNFSGNYFDQTGVIENSSLQRVTARFNSEARVNSWFRVGNNLAYTNSLVNLEPGVVNSAYRIPPVFAPRDSNGNFSDPTSPFGLAIGNPAAELFYRDNRVRRENRFFGTIYGDITFLKNFTFRSNFGFDIDQRNSRFFTPIYRVSNSQLTTIDQLALEKSERRDWIWEQTLTYNQEWTNHRLNVLAGYTAEQRRDESVFAGRANFAGSSDDLLYLDAGNDTTQTNRGFASDEALVSYLFRTNYTFFERYLFTFSMRVDQSSRFLEENRTGYFPSFSLGWNVGQEQFIQRLNTFDRLKVRFSWGRIGNQASARRYPSFGAITSNLYVPFGSNEALNQGATLVSFGNPDLRWETTEQANLGLEVGLFNNRLSAEIDFYSRRTFDIISAVAVPDYVGTDQDPLVNTAEVLNQGIDLTLNWRQAGDFSWNVGFIFSPVRNEVQKLNNDEQTDEILASFIQGEPASRTVVGQPIGGFYGYQMDGIFNDQAEIDALNSRARELTGNSVAVYQTGSLKPGDIKFRDNNGDGIVDAEDREYLGSPIPTLSYGLSAGFEWRGIDFSADVFGVSGNKIFNEKKVARFSVYNWEQSFYDGRWTPENPDADRPRITNGGSNYRVSDYFIEDGSFFRLRTIVLGYSLPKIWLDPVRISRLRVYISGFNLWTSQKYSGYSPEFGNRDDVFRVGFDGGIYPVTKSYQFGVDVTF